MEQLSNFQLLCMGCLALPFIGGGAIFLWNTVPWADTGFVNVGDTTFVIQTHIINGKTRSRERKLQGK